VLWNDPGTDAIIIMLMVYCGNEAVFAVGNNNYDFVAGGDDLGTEAGDPV